MLARQKKKGLVYLMGGKAPVCGPLLSAELSFSSRCCYCSSTQRVLCGFVTGEACLGSALTLMLQSV